MTKIGIAAVLLCCLLTTKVSSDDSYLCISDISTGFRFNKALDKWDIVNFIVDEERYFINKSIEKNIAWEVTQIGKSSKITLCKEDFDEYGFLYCESNIIFKMNKLNLRFLKIYPTGYYNSSSKNNQDIVLYKDGSSKPYIEIGRCSPVEKSH